MPFRHTLEKSKLFTGDYGLPNLKELKHHFFNEGRLKLEDALSIIDRCTIILKQEANLLNVQDPVIVVGDLHGQYYDLLKVFEIGGELPDTKYLFLGDYVDRGCFSCEVALYLFACKVTFPKHVFLLRGNHECRHLAEYFNFRLECERKYSIELYNAFMECFDALPLAATINDKFFAVHGGISPELKYLSDINKFNRFREPPPSGLMTDLLWSDPAADYDEESNGRNKSAFFRYNNTRGCSWSYGYEAVLSFLDTNSLVCIIRAHEAQDEGYKAYRKHRNNGFHTIITIFSAPNYCDCYKNKASILKFENNVMNIRQFACVPHPYWLPEFMNGLIWSIPFLAEKTAECISVIYTIIGDMDVTLQERAEIIRAKVTSISRWSHLYTVLQTNSETIGEIKAILDTGTLPKGMLTAGPDALRDALDSFVLAKRYDQSVIKGDTRPVIRKKSDMLMPEKVGAMEDSGPLEDQQWDALIINRRRAESLRLARSISNNPSRFFADNVDWGTFADACQKVYDKDTAAKLLQTQQFHQEQEQKQVIEWVSEKKPVRPSMGVIVDISFPSTIFLNAVPIDLPPQ